MKLSIIGGGGFRVPLVYQALVAGEQVAGHGPLIDQVWLHDTSADRLAVIESVLSQLPHPIPVHATTVLDQALEGSDFVFSAIRVGGLPGRIADERAAIELGVIGQETTGPGGIAYALRTIPVALRMASRVRALAPDAIINVRVIISPADVCSRNGCTPSSTRSRCANWKSAPNRAACFFMLSISSGP